MTTPLHYDLAYNFYAQISGKKGFLFISPTLWKFFCLFPRIHPSSRMSQVPWESWDMEKWKSVCPTLNFVFNETDPNSKNEDFVNEGNQASKIGDSAPKNSPDFQRTKRDRDFQEILQNDILSLNLSEHIMYTIVQPGDLLFIPPYWGHHVSTLDEVSFSVSSHLTSPVMSLREKLNAVGIPSGNAKKTDFSPLILFRLMKGILLSLKEQNHSHLLTFFKHFVRHLIQTRYEPLRQDEATLGLVDFLEQSEILWKDVPDFEKPVPPGMKREISIKVEEVKAVLEMYPKGRDTFDILLIELQNWFEDHISMWIGPEKVWAYLNELLFYLDL